jgi:hypothetical protein
VERAGKRIMGGALETRVYIFPLLLTPIMLLNEEETLECHLSGPELLLSPFSALGISIALILRVKLDVNLSSRVYNTTTR